MKRILGKYAGRLAALLVVVLVLLATWKLTLGNRIIARGDLLLYFYPLRDYASAAIRALRLPLWEPYTFMGAPFLANSQVGFFYPFNIITAWTPVAHAVAWNIVLHLAIAAAGMFVLARRDLRLSVLASFAAAISFGLGGYLGAQIEHLNQLQVLAWLPLQAALVLPESQGQPRFGLRIVLLSLVVTLQIMAGHTQSLYICLVTLLIVIVGTLLARLVSLWLVRHADARGETFLQGVIGAVQHLWRGPILRKVALSLGLLMIAAALAALMSAVQLAPTLELASQSARSGGLTLYEVGSFSWRPWVIARALLPTYGDPLFAEYVAYLGVAGLALALLGGLSIFRTRAETPDATSETNTRAEQALLAILLIGAGVILALGIATPVFNVLYKLAPGFNLFRAQTRWLIVFALGSALAIGLGVQMLQDGLNRRLKRAWFIGWVVLSMVVVSALLLGARFSPEVEYRTLPATPVLIGWAVAFVVVSLLILGATDHLRIESLLGQLARLKPRVRASHHPGLEALAGPSRPAEASNPNEPALRTQGFSRSPHPAKASSPSQTRKLGVGVAPLFCLFLCAELLIASQFQPYARASDDQALTDLRPATADLLASRQLAGLSQNAQSAGSAQRILALSGLFFDPGDLAEQTLIYGSQLSADELYDRVIASKQKEVLSPNLSLYYRLPGVDGYDGGLLPLRTFSSFTQQFLPPPNDPGTTPGTTDGRLRELLHSVPTSDWLERMAVKYVIADKTHDVFLDNVYYDLLFPQPLSETVRLPLDPFDSTALGIVLSAPGHLPDDLLLRATLTDSAGVIGSYGVRATQAVTGTYFGVTLRWEGRRTPAAVTFTPVVSGVILLGMTSIDEPAGAFQSQPIRWQYDMRLVHSGDVKIYQNNRSAPRAFIASLADCSTQDGQLQVNVTGADSTPADSAGNVTIARDEPDLMTLDVEAQVPGWLVVRDAYYPGWVARIDGVPTPISPADVMFRAIQILPGKHRVSFTYEPSSVRLGAILSGAGLVAWLALGLTSLILPPNSTRSKKYAR